MMNYSGDYLSREQVRKLNKRYANCERLRGSSWVWESAVGEYTLISYDKVVLTWKPTTRTPQLWVVDDAFECSPTTSRHISEFLRKYVGADFQSVKRAFNEVRGGGTGCFADLGNLYVVCA